MNASIFTRCAVGVLVAAVALFSPSAPQARAQAPQAFVHPGIPLTNADLTILRSNIDREPWKTGYEALKADGRSRLDYKMRGPKERISRAPHVDRHLWMSDMQAAWNLARMWCFTQDASYAQKSRDILIAWATTLKEFAGSEANLDLGDYAFRYVGAADLLRGTWPGWTEADTDACKRLFRDVYWPRLGLIRGSMGPANKGMLSLVAGGAIAAFCDDRDRFDLVIDLFRTSNSCGLPNTLSIGEIGESGRDQGHAYGQWLSMAMLSEICWKQGVDLFSERDNRLLAVGEYFARTNLLEPTPFVPFGTVDWHYLTLSKGGWPHGQMGFHLLRGAYGIRKGLPTPWMDRRWIQLTQTNVDDFVFLKSADDSVAKPLPPVASPLLASLTSGLKHADLAGALPAGDATYSERTWTVRGGGEEIWTNGDDSAHFAYRLLDGDCAMVARVTSIEQTHIGAKAGLMIRTSLDPQAPRAWVAITPSRTAEFQFRNWTDLWSGAYRAKGVREILQGPYWVKIERKGETLGLFASADGTSWATLSSARYADLPSKLYLGLVVCSLKNGTSCTATFTDVQITGGDGNEKPAVPAAPLAICGAPGDAKVPLRWLESAGAITYNVKRSDRTGGPYKTLASVRGTSYFDRSANNGQTYYYVVSAVNSAGESTPSSEEPVTPAPSPVSSTTASESGGRSDLQKIELRSTTLPSGGSSN
jgi:hypothetical protein